MMPVSTRSYDGKYVFFEVTSPEELDYAHIEELQAKAGYHSAGYGGPMDVKEVRTKDGDRIYRWYCYGSAD